MRFMCRGFKSAPNQKPQCALNQSQVEGGVRPPCLITWTIIHVLAGDTTLKWDKLEILVVFTAERH